MQVTAHACAATERLLLLLGWERVVKHTVKHTVKHAAKQAKRPRGGADQADDAYRQLKADVHKRKSVGATPTTDSSWERERPQLRMPTVSVPLVVATRAESSWTPDAFEVGEHTGTV